MADKIDRKLTEKNASESRLRHPLAELHKEVNRLFDTYSPHVADIDFEPFHWLRSGDYPAIDFTKRESEYAIMVELPGMKEGEFDITVADHMLTLKGEKSEERVEKERDYYLSERSYGSFERNIKLPDDAITSDIDASFRDGVLQILVQRSEDAKAMEQKISVRTA